MTVTSHNVCVHSIVLHSRDYPCLYLIHSPKIFMFFLVIICPCLNKHNQTIHKVCVIWLEPICISQTLLARQYVWCTQLIRLRLRSKASWSLYDVSPHPSQSLNLQLSCVSVNVVSLPYCPLFPPSS